MDQKYSWRQRKIHLVQTYSKLGFVISYLENYLEMILPETSFPFELIFHILKININDNHPTRVRYYYIHLEGKMSTSPFRHYMIRKSPYFSRYTKLPMHDLFYHSYLLDIRENSISLSMISTTREYSDFKLSFVLSYGDYEPGKSIRDFLQGISCFNDFKEKLLEHWRYSDIKPDILDNRNDFYKMRQMWAVIYTVRGMIDFPLRSE